jgi:hypothetical protein
VRVVVEEHTTRKVWVTHNDGPKNLTRPPGCRELRESRWIEYDGPSHEKVPQLTAESRFPDRVDTRHSPQEIENAITQP